MQICAEVAIVILDEATPASRNWITWRDILHLVDIICCCAVLFPIVWSIKHLREASEVCLASAAERASSRRQSGHNISAVQTDGKAARNLAKLQLFRQFYVMVVSYIYFTRIVVYLLRSTVLYQWVWLADVAEQVRQADNTGMHACSCLLRSLHRLPAGSYQGALLDVVRAL